jgi:nucleotide-binding universal stress UspA family protein
MLSAITASHFRPQKILLPIDFSPSSQAALEMGRDLAQHFNCELVLLTVVPMFSADKISDEYISTFLPDSVRSDELAQFANIASVLVSEGIRASARTEVSEDVAGTIMVTIKNELIDLLIISTHGRTGWREAIFGSIADRVVKQADCPLLLLRSVKPTVSTEEEKDKVSAASLSSF